jgi:hypothetical protein
MNKHFPSMLVNSNISNHNTSLNDSNNKDDNDDYHNLSTVTVLPESEAELEV